MNKVQQIPTPYLNALKDKLGLMIPLVDFCKLDIRQPNLVRVKVDSTVAKEMLSLNVKNRRQRKPAVDYLKRQIVLGEWRDDHPQPVIFSDKGRLIDGQHRLQAIMELDIGINDAVIVRVETGARDDVREYLDTGVPRSLDDRVELVENQMHNKLIAQLAGWHMFVTAGGRQGKPSPDDAREFFAQHSKAALFVAYHHRRDKGVGKVQIAYAAMEYFERNANKAEEFYPALFAVDSDVQQARMLRDYALRTIGTTRSMENTGSGRRDMYFRSVACMKAHSQGRTIAIVRKAEW